MADQIFQVNSSSFQDVEISASLKAGPSIVVDFTQASTVTGSFTGEGTGLVNVSASYIVPNQNTTASYADTSSWAINAINGGTQLITASTYPITSSWSETASYVDTAAFDNLVLTFEFKFSNTTTAGDPGNGKFRYNSAASQSITNVYVSSTTNNGLDISTIVNSLHSGSYQLYIQQKSDSTKASIFQVANAVADSGSWFGVPVIHLSSAGGGLPTNNQLCALFVINKNSIVEGQTYPVTASWSVSASWAPDVESSASATASYLMPGATFYVVSGSDGIPPAYIEPYDYSPESSVYMPPYKAGRIFWDNRYNDWAWYVATGSGATSWRSHLGKEISFTVHNPYSVTLPRLSAVYIGTSSIAGAYYPDVYLAIADGTNTHANVAGIIRNDIPSGSIGFMLQIGIMHRTNMGSFNIGDTLWLSTTTPGGITSVEPGQPNEQVRVGYCSETGSLGSFICDIYTLPVPSNAYAGMTSIPIITDALNSASVDFTSSLYIGSASVNLFGNTSGVGAISGYPLLPTTVSVPVGGNTLYVYAQLGGGSASYGITSDFSSINQTTKVPVSVVYRADVDAHWVETNQEGLALANKLNQRLQATERFTRENGLSLAETGSRFITITEGAAWIGATRFIEHAFDSRLTGSDFQSGSFHELHLAYHSNSIWQVPVAVDGKYENRYYDNGTNLVPLSADKYTLNYVFRIFGENNNYDEDAFIVLSNNQYTSVPEAQADTIPANVPSVLSEVGLLVGRIIVQSGSLSASLVESAFVSSFGTSIINSHNNLGGLEGGNNSGHYEHLGLQEYSDFQGATGTGVYVRKDGATLTNATITGSITTASFVQVAQTASFVQLAQTAAFVTTAQTASFVQLAQTSSFVTTAQTASFVQLAQTSAFVTTAQTASFVTTAQTASYVASTLSSSYADTSSWAINAINGGTQLVTASTYPITASNAVSASWAPDVDTGTTLVTASTYQITASSAVSASWSPNQGATTLVTASTYQITSSRAISASWSPNQGATTLVTASTYPITASWATNALTADASTSASWATASYTSSYLVRNRTYEVTASMALNVSTLSSSASGSYNLLLATSSAGSQQLYVDYNTNLRYNAQSDVFSVLNVSASTVSASAISASTYRGIPFSRGGTFYDALGIAGSASYSQSVTIWRAPFNCTVTNVWASLGNGDLNDTASVNARRNFVGQIASGSGAANTHIIITGSVWQSASSILTSSFSTGDTLEIMLISSSGFPTQVAIQVDFVM